MMTIVLHKKADIKEQIKSLGLYTQYGLEPFLANLGSITMIHHPSLATSVHLNETSMVYVEDHNQPTHKTLLQYI